MARARAKARARARGEAHRSCVGEAYEAGVAPSVPPKREKVQSAPISGSGEKFEPLTLRRPSDAPPKPPAPRAPPTAAAAAAAAAAATAAEAGATVSRVSGRERSKTTKRADEGDHDTPPSAEEET